MADRTVKTILAAEDRLSPALMRASQSAGRLAEATDKAQAKIGGLGKASGSGLDSLTKRLEASGAAADRTAMRYEAVGRAGQAVALAAAAAGVGVGAMVKKYADFDEAMSGVGAATMASAAELDKLRAAAIKLGGDTQYSAREAADAITEMAKAGVSTADILTGGLKGALSLAAAGQLDVAEAAETASAAMVQFKLDGADLGHVADLLAAGAGKAMGSVHDMGMALKQAGLVASATGLSIEETVGGLSAFASAGLVGSDAGTSFKTMLQRLTPQSKEAAAQMELLGVHAYDGQGRFVGLADVAGQLQQSMGTLSAEQRQAAMQTIFGSDAIRAATVLYEQGAQGIQQWIDKVNDQGYAAEQAARLTDNLAGDWERLTGAFDSVVMKSGSGVNDALRSMAQGGEALLEVVGKIPAPLLQAGAAATALGVAAAAGLGAIGMAVPKIMAGKAALDALGISAGRAGLAMKAAGVAAGAIVVASAAEGLNSMFGSMQVGSRDASALADSLASVASGSQDADEFLRMFGDGMGPFHRSALSVSDAMYKFGENARQALDPSTWGRIDFVTQEQRVGKFGERVSQLDAALAEMVSSGRADAAADVFAELMRNAQEAGAPIDEVRAKFEKYSQAVSAGSAAHAKAKEAAIASAAAAAGLTAEEYKLKTSLEEAKKATEGFRSSVEALGATLLSQRDAARGFEAAVDSASDAVTKNGRTLDIHTEKGRANQAALDGVAVAGTKAARAILENGGSIEQAAVQVDKTRAAFVAAAVKMGMSRTEANKLATQLGLTKDKVIELAQAAGQVPKTITSKVEVVGLKEAQAQLAALAKKLGDMDNRTYAAQFVTTYINRGLAPAGAVRAAARATGGPVIGPGTETSDSIPALLSNNEHVLTAAEVSAYGGHGAVMRLRKAMLARRVPRFAGGGAATLSGSAVMGSAGTLGRVADGLEFSATANVDRVIPPKSPIPMQFEISNTDLATLRGPELVSLLTGIDLPDLDPAVKKVRDGITRVAQSLDQIVQASKSAIESADRATWDAATSAAKSVTASTSTASAGAPRMSGALGSSAAKPYLPQILAMGAKYGVAPELIAAVIKQESGFNPNAGSSAGARGLMQLMPGTFRGLGVSGSITNPSTNIEAGTKYLSQQLKAFGGDIVKALQAYNAGPGAARSGAASRYRETQQYVKKITADAGVKSLAGSARYSSSILADTKKLAGDASVAKAAAGAAAKAVAPADRNAQFIEVLKALKAAGLRVRENEALGDKVDPVHTKGSWHYRTGAYGKSMAADITGTQAQMHAAAKILNDAGFRTLWQTMTGGNHYNHVHADLSTGASIGSKGRGTLPGYVPPAQVKSTVAATAATEKLAEAQAAQYKLSAAAEKQIRAQADAVDALKRRLVEAAPELEGLAVAHAEAAENAKRYSDELSAARKAQDDYAASIAATVVGQGELSKLWRLDSEAGTITAISHVIDEREKLVVANRAFAESVKELDALGLNRDDLADIIGMGATAGGRLAKQLIDERHKGWISDLNATRSELEQAAGKVGADFGELIHGDHIKAAGEVAEAWASKAADLADTAWQVGRGIQDGILDGMGLKDGALARTTTSLLEQLRSQWLTSLGITPTAVKSTPRPVAPAVTTQVRVDAPQVKMPEVMTLVDYDGTLIGRMRVEADGAVARRDAVVATGTRWS